jgi:5-methylcytosine-specific restriction protein A
MGIRKEHHRHSKRITRGPRWKALRMQALNRDGWKCVRCGTQMRLEVDHIKPVRTHPELAYSLANLQCLCGSCHTKKTRIEVGHKPLTPKRQEWRDLLRDMQRNPVEHKETNHADI